MIEREVAPHLTGLFEKYPFVTVTGPRQSGKTTLCRSAFPDLAYANLEAPDQRYFAESDPRGFLARFAGPAIIDKDPARTPPPFLFAGDRRRPRYQRTVTC